MRAGGWRPALHKGLLEVNFVTTCAAQFRAGSILVILLVPPSRQWSFSTSRLCIGRASKERMSRCTTRPVRRQIEAFHRTVTTTALTFFINLVIQRRFSAVFEVVSILLK
jgi:hypothetical protein